MNSDPSDSSTPTNSTLCPKCSKNCNSLYITFDPISQKYAYWCYGCVHGTKAVAGISSWIPCPKCVPPNVNWFCQRTYGEIDDGCHLHSSLKQQDEDEPLKSIFD